MDRRSFFRFGFSGLKDAVKKGSPEIIREKIGTTLLDLSILTEDPIRADRLFDEMLSEYFEAGLMRLRRSTLSGNFPGGIVLFEDNRLRNYHDGISLFHTALIDVENELDLRSDQINPTLLRFVNKTPPLSRSVEIFHSGLLVMALPLSEDLTTDFEGSFGKMRFETSNGHFRIAASTCKHQICVAHPPIIAPGQRITCVPNRVTAIIGAQL